MSDETQIYLRLEDANNTSNWSSAIRAGEEYFGIANKELPMPVQAIASSLYLMAIVQEVASGRRINERNEAIVEKVVQLAGICLNIVKGVSPAEGTREHKHCLAAANRACNGIGFAATLGIGKYPAELWERLAHYSREFAVILGPDNELVAYAVDAKRHI